MTETTVAQPTKTEIRRMHEKELRASIKPDYRSAGVTVKVLKANPKKVGSKAHAVFALYADGRACAEILAEVDKGELHDAKGEVVTKSYAGACLAWDARHGFIALVAPAK